MDAVFLIRTPVLRGWSTRCCCRGIVAAPSTVKQGSESHLRPKPRTPPMPLLVLTDETGSQLRMVEVADDILVSDLKVIAELHLAIPTTQQVLVHNGVDLEDPLQSIKNARIGANDCILVRRKTSARSPGKVVPERTQSQISEMLLANVDAAAQLKIEKAIRKKNIQRNMEEAMENHPESFGRVVMLYIDVEVNGVPVKAFVDSGAQATIMSPSCAERCKIMHLLDERFAGIAEGVGIARILGRVHSEKILIGSQKLSCSFTIMEGNGVDLLFGLDLLRRHNACIDLSRNCLRINGEEIEFLPEHALPDAIRERERVAREARKTVWLPRGASLPQKNGDSGGPSSSATSTSASGQGDDSAVNQLMELGATREKAIAALKKSGWNPEAAADILF